MAAIVIATGHIWRPRVVARSDASSLTEPDAQILIGPAAAYEIADVVDPNLAAVAKIRRAMVPRR